MFSLIRRRRKRFGFEKHPEVQYFGQGLNRKQKAAMAHVFLTVLNSDSSMNLKMYNYIYEQLELLGFGIKSKYMQAYLEQDLTFSFNQIKDLNLEQKKWFAKALHAMLYEIGVKPTFKHIQSYLMIGQETINPFIK